MSQLILVALNELNFDMVRRYLGSLELPNFRALMQGASVVTGSEAEYENLEPWIQWVSVHTGLTAGEHGVHRLGDIVGTRAPQVFEQLEASGVSVGCVCPMNAENRLRNPAYFVPDPWTRTPADGSFWSRALSEAISQAVNDNAQSRLTLASAAKLALGLLRFASPRNYLSYARLALGSRGKPWRRALFLDLFLHDLHRSLFRRKAPRFSTVFFNAGAHIQHHYYFSEKSGQPYQHRNPEWYVDGKFDPVAEMLQVYDRILGDYLAMPEVDLLVATGLTQRPYDRLKYYYRLRDHARFLELCGVRFKSVAPRMTRDFLIQFDTPADAAEAQSVLGSLTAGEAGKPLFGEIENRGDSLFTTLTYPDEITASTVFGPRREPLSPHVAFVALKNGMHSAEGFCFFRGRIAEFAPAPGSHVASLHETITGYFGSTNAARAPG